MRKKFSNNEPALRTLKTALGGERCLDIYQGGKLQVYKSVLVSGT